jgi:hypothetical protein
MGESRQDRELIELLNELRVVLPGMQVLFAFMLTVPFSQGWPKITSPQRTVFFVAFLSISAATAFLIAPTAFHRLRWREGDKERMLEVSNRFAIIGTALLAIAMTCVVFVLTDHIYGGPLSIITTTVAGILFASLWFALPLLRAAKDDD